MIMSRLFRYVVAMIVGLCTIFFVMQVKAEAPDRGYRVVKTDDKDAVVIEIGKDTSYKTLNANFGVLFKKSTGFDLDSLEGLEALQGLNPETTIPVCWPPGNGAIYKGAKHTEVWASCPAAQKTLWLIAGRTIRLPLVNVTVETFSQKWERLTTLDECKDAACVVAHLKDGSRWKALVEPKTEILVAAQRSSSASGAAPTPIASVSSDAAAHAKMNAEITRPTSELTSVRAEPDAAQKNPHSGYFHWGWFAAAIVSFVVFLVFTAKAGYDPYLMREHARKTGELAEAEQELVTAKADHVAAAKQAKQFQDTVLVEFVSIASKVDARLTSAMNHTAMHDAIVAAQEALKDLLGAARLECTNLREEIKAKDADFKGVGDRFDARKSENETLASENAKLLVRLQEADARAKAHTSDADAPEAQGREREEALQQILQALGLDANASPESIVALGASGILHDATQRAQAAEARVKALEAQVIQIERVNNFLGKDLSSAREELDSAPKIASSSPDVSQIRSLATMGDERQPMDIWQVGFLESQARALAAAIGNRYVPIRISLIAALGELFGKTYMVPEAMDHGGSIVLRDLPTVGPLWAIGRVAHLMAEECQLLASQPMAANAI
ncbi:MAG: hypothetical protein AAB879_03810 [Patescibacteria group bacterium]